MAASGPGEGAALRRWQRASPSPAVRGAMGGRRGRAGPPPVPRAPPRPGGRRLRPLLQAGLSRPFPPPTPGSWALEVCGVGGSRGTLPRAGGAEWTEPRAQAEGAPAIRAVRDGREKVVQSESWKHQPHKKLESKAASGRRRPRARPWTTARSGPELLGVFLGGVGNDSPTHYRWMATAASRACAGARTWEPFPGQVPGSPWSLGGAPGVFLIFLFARCGGVGVGGAGRWRERDASGLVHKYSRSPRSLAETLAAPDATGLRGLQVRPPGAAPTISGGGS